MMDQKLQLNPVFTSVGVNRVVNTLDWGANGLIAYGGHSIVCIYDHKVCNTLLHFFAVILGTHQLSSWHATDCEQLYFDGK